MLSADPGRVKPTHFWRRLSEIVPYDFNKGFESSPRFADEAGRDDASRLFFNYFQIMVNYKYDRPKKI